MHDNIEKIYDALCCHLTVNNSTDECFLHFRSLNTNETRVQYMYEKLQNYQLFPNIEQPKKDNKTAVEYRQNGNKLFGSKDDNGALKQYNASIAFAECSDTNNECLSLAYANRSAVLFEMGYYKECLEDISRAISSGYPQKLRPKLKQRSQKAESLLKSTKEFKYCEKVPELTTERNPKINSASKALNICYSDELGRHVVASEDINIGDVIAIEKPYVCSILPDYFYTHCHTCLMRVLNPVPCTKCQYAVFCNQRCLKQAFEGSHRYICLVLPTLVTLKVNKMLRLALETTIKAKMHLNEIVNDEIADCSKTGFIFDNGNYVYDSGSYNSVHHLATNEKLREVKDLSSRAMASAILLYLLENNTDLFCDNVPLNIEKHVFRNIIADLLLRHSQTAPTNMHEVSEYVGEDIIPLRGNYSSNEYGSGAYPFLSLINHSCMPNVSRHCHGTTIVLRAICEIKKGEQIFDNYGYHFAIHSLQERQSSLLFQYHFRCNCTACIYNWPVYEQLPLINAKIKTDMVSLVDNLDKENIDKTINSFISMMNEACLKQIAPSKDQCILEEALKHCYALQANRFEEKI